MEDLVDAMLRNSQALAKALAADRARLEAADRIQRESWEAARRLQRRLQRRVVEMQVEMDRLRADAADAKKKLQSDESRKMRWEAAYELLLGANQKLAEIRDGDMEDSRTCAQTPNSKLKVVESCTKLSQNTTNRITSDIRKQKQAYETLSSKKDKEVSALLSERGSLRSQIDIMQKNYAKLLKNKKVEADQATEKALELQQSVDELKVLAQKKDDEIGRLQAEAVGARRSLQKMHSLVKEKDDEIQRLKGWHPESVQKRNKDFSETHKKSRFGDPAVTVRDKLKNANLRQTVQDCISVTKPVGKGGQEETTQKRRRASSMSNDDEISGSDEVDDKQIGNDEDDDKQSGGDEDGDEQTGSDEDGDEQSRSDEFEQIGSDEDGDKRSGSDEDGDEQSESDEDGDELTRSAGGGDDDAESRSDEHKQRGSGEETRNSPIQKSLGNPKRKRDACNAETANRKSHTGSNGVTNWRWSYVPPRPLCCRRLLISHGRRSMISTGNWAQFVRDVKDSLADKPDKRKDFDRFLRDLNQESLFYRHANAMKHVLDGQPELIRQLNVFLPDGWQI